MSSLDLGSMTTLEERKSVLHVKIKEPVRDLSDDEIYETKETEAFAIKRESKITKQSHSIIDEGYEEVFRELGSESDSEESLSPVSSYTRPMDFSLRADFFEDLGEIPDLDEISIDKPPEIEIEPVLKSASVIVPDSGKFVDPLTGQMVDESSEESAVPSLAEEEGKEEEEEDEDFEFDLGLPPDVEEDEQLGDKAKVLEDETFEALIGMDTEKVVELVEEIDFEAVERENAARQLRENTNEFLEEIITIVVDTCEYIDPDNILRQNLDKMKLMNELALKLEEVELEQKARFFLNRKTVEYFRRKKIYRCITEDNPATLQQDIEKFKETTANLDLLLGKEEETSRVTEVRIFHLESEARRMEEKAHEKLQAFEDMVRKTLFRETFDKLKASVENQLQKKLEKLENLGNGLKMRDFENLQTQTQGLGKKIEERNAELNKLRMRCNADLHIRAHMKMRQQMVSNTTGIQESALQDLIIEKQNCREHLYDLKISRGHIRKEIQELSFQGGLLDKPALMLDYDETVERLEQLRGKVNNNKAKFAEIHHRIHRAEGKCGDDNDEF